MESGVPTSFIPQDATSSRRSRTEDGGGGFTDLLQIGAIILFVVSAALGVATFLYAQFLDKVSTQKHEQLLAASKAIDAVQFQQWERLDNRMHAADALLAAHIAPTAFFAALNATTLQTISFSDLSFDVSDHILKIKMSGVAKSVNSIALQADLFSKSGVITSPIFSAIDRQPDGVHFSVSALVNPSALNYVSLVNGQQPAGVNPLPVQSPPPTDPSNAPGPFGQPTQ